MPTICFPPSFENHDGFLRLKVPLSPRSYDYLTIVGSTEGKGVGAPESTYRQKLFRANDMDGSPQDDSCYSFIPVRVGKSCLTLNTLIFTSRSAYNVRTSFNTARKRGVACSQANAEEIVPVCPPLDEAAGWICYRARSPILVRMPIPSSCSRT